MEADYILKSSAIFDSIDDKPCAGGAVIKGNKIVGVFSEPDLNSYRGPGTNVIDYGDKLIIPGFIDSHTHMGMAMGFEDKTFCVDISPAHTFPEIMRLMQEFGGKYPDSPVIYGINFNFFNLDEYFVPTAKAMDEYFPDRPALLMTWDCHTWYANTKAIKMAGLTKDSPDPNHA